MNVEIQSQAVLVVTVLDTGRTTVSTAHVVGGPLTAAMVLADGAAEYLHGQIQELESHVPNGIQPKAGRGGA